MHTLHHHLQFLLFMNWMFFFYILHLFVHGIPSHVDNEGEREREEATEKKRSNQTFNGQCSKLKHYNHLFCENIAIFITVIVVIQMSPDNSIKWHQHAKPYRSIQNDLYIIVSDFFSHFLSSLFSCYSCCYCYCSISLRRHVMVSVIKFSLLYGVVRGICSLLCRR